MKNCTEKVLKHMPQIITKQDFNFKNTGYHTFQGDCEHRTYLVKRYSCQVMKNMNCWTHYFFIWCLTYFLQLFPFYNLRKHQEFSVFLMVSVTGTNSMKWVKKVSGVSNGWFCHKESQYKKLKRRLDVLPLCLALPLKVNSKTPRVYFFIAFEYV